ncbi:MAG TPA: hypothetical protein VGN57_09190 [Pirellulaceae bacterium]|jgi:hypothetical protein|nr:hypothetical protein [Pirellulaceae bacterium]
MKKTRASEGLIVAAALLLLPGAYVGAYLTLSEPVPQVYRSPDGKSEGRSYRERIGGGVGGGYLETFFWPLTQLDRKLRPERWA